MAGWIITSNGCLLVFFCLIRIHHAVAFSMEKRLIRHLLRNYQLVGMAGRPVQDSTEKVSVQYGLSLIQIIELDEKEQVLVTNVWSHYGWRDGILRWDGDDFEGIEVVRVPIEDIWSPDIVLFNHVDTRLEERREAMAMIWSNGTVLWRTTAILKSSCSINAVYFPFDTQECSLKFGSWAYDAHKMDVDFYQMADLDVREYVASQEWEVVAHGASKSVSYYSCCEEPYSHVTFTLTLRRRAAIYYYTLILPCILLASLTLVIFCLPTDSTEKVGFGMSIFVAFLVLLLILADATPSSRTSVPLLGIYFCLNMVLITLSAFLSAIVNAISEKGSKGIQVPWMIRKVIVDGLGSVMGLDTNADRQSSTPGETDQPDIGFEHPLAALPSSDGDEDNKYQGETLQLQPVQDSQRIRQPTETCLGDLGREIKHIGFEHPLAALPSSDGDEDNKYQGETLQLQPVQDSQRIRQPTETCLGDMGREIKYVKNILDNIFEKIRAEKVNDNIAREWKVVARVVDRCILIIYSATILLSLIIFFTKV